MKIKSEILPILSTLLIDGNGVRIAEQLDRKQYVATNEVLEALGGKWNKKAKAHLFPTDPVVEIERALLTGEVTTAKDFGFFPTPMPLAEKLVKLAGVKPGDTCLEPSAGDGNLVMAMFAAGAKTVYAVEIDDRRRQKTLDRFLASGHVKERTLITADAKDFMTFKSGEYDRVVMNPAFLKVGLGDHLDHTKRAYDFLRPGGKLAGILPNGVVFRNDRKHSSFRDWYTTIGGVVAQLPADSFAESGTGVCTVTLQLTKS